MWEMKTMKIRTIEFIEDETQQSAILFERIMQRLIIQYLTAQRDTDIEIIGEILRKQFGEELDV